MSVKWEIKRKKRHGKKKRGGEGRNLTIKSHHRRQTQFSEQEFDPNDKRVKQKRLLSTTLQCSFFVPAKIELCALLFV